MPYELASSGGNIIVLRATPDFFYGGGASFHDLSIISIPVIM